MVAASLYNRSSHNALILTGRALIILVISIYSSGCSSIVALQQDKNQPQLSKIRFDQSREEVLIVLGKPSGSVENDEGRKDVYLFEKGRTRSVGSAIGHLAGNALTYGMWEVFAVPAELKRKKFFEIIVEYNTNDEVIGLRSNRVEVKKEVDENGIVRLTRKEGD